MIRISLAYFYNIALTLNRLRQIEENTDLSNHWFDLFQVNQAVSTFLDSSIFAGTIRTSYDSGKELLRQVDLLIDDTKPDRKFHFMEVSRLIGALNQFETVLRAELAGPDAYFVTPKRGYDTLRLVTQGEIIWPPDLALKVPEAVQDAREAGKCIAFELGTAAGFHILRATESVLLRYWDTVSGGKPRPTNRNLGNYLAKLTSGNFGDPKIIAALTQIKDLHRNTLFHPEETLTVQEAIELTGIVQSAVGAMLKALPVVSSEAIPPDPMEDVEPPSTSGPEPAA